MPAVVILAVVVVAGLPLLRPTGWRGGGDIPARIVAVAICGLPACLREWGRAIAVELPQIPDRAGRWRFAGGVLRLALFPPVRGVRRLLVTALAGLAAAAGVTAATAGEVPSLTVFAVSFGLLVGGYATVATWRRAWDGWTGQRAILAVVAAAGVAASVTDAVWVAVFHPATITDSKNGPEYSVALAVLLVAFLAAALSLPRGSHAMAILRWGLGGALASGTVDVAGALIGVAGAQFAVCVVTALAAAAWVCATTGSRSAGVRAGLLVAALSAPMRFAVDITTLLGVHRYVLTDGYDIAAFPHSNYPDVASFLLSDALGGAILSGMLITSVLMAAAAMLGAALGAGAPRSSIAG